MRRAPEIRSVRGYAWLSSTRAVCCVPRMGVASCAWRRVLLPLNGLQYTYTFSPTLYCAHFVAYARDSVAWTWQPSHVRS